MTSLELDTSLRAAAESICRQFCRVAAGDLSVQINAPSDDLTAQKLALLANGVLHVARSAVAAAEAKERERAAAHEMARLGTWRAELTAGVPRWNMSPELQKLLGMEVAHFDLGEDPLRALIHSEDQVRVAEAHARALAGTVEAYEWRAVCPDGIDRRIWTEIHPERNGEDVIALCAICQDVTERRAVEARIRHLAEHDALTSLVNRTVLRDHLGKALLHRARRAGPPMSVAVLCVDLDGFKGVNDRHGHAGGDRVLVQAAARMRALVRGGDTLARLGGDEFAIIQAAPPDSGAVERLAQRLVSALAEPYDLGAGLEAAAITASVGIAIAPTDGDEVDSLLAAADTALYRAKASGRNGACFYRPEMEQEARERLALEADLRLALGRGELSLAYQLLVAVESGTVLGFEALMRWRHAERGYVSPDLFIPVAEVSGAILRLGEWALREACVEAGRWPEPLFVAVNVSPVQVQRGAAFAEMVKTVLAETGLPPERLELEVTEGVLIREADAALDALQRVRALGVRVALDDFGTGYSSLATLQAFPFDKIKVDKRFTAGLGGSSAQDATIVRAVLGLARGLSVPVVAEGVETSDQLEALREENCAEAQGWLFGHPGPVPATWFETGSYGELD